MLIPCYAGTQSCTPEECKDWVLTRGYTCRRPLDMVPFAFDYLAHCALLSDAHTAQQAADLQKEPEAKVPPRAQFMFERLVDHKNPETGKL